MPKGYTYVISDIHGCFDEFCHVLARSGFAANDRLFILGDAIDRGPQSVSVIKWLLNAPSNVTYMLGNHELMMLEDVDDPSSTNVSNLTNWGYNGGGETGAQMMRGLTEQERIDYFDLCQTLSPAASVKYRDANNGGFLTEAFLIHAGCFIDTKILTEATDISNLVSKQSLTDLVWERDTWLGSGWDPPLPVIFGHTPVRLASQYLTNIRSTFGSSPCGNCYPSDAMLRRGSRNLAMRWGNHIDIDCGCAYNGKLACLRLEDMHVFYSDDTEEDLPRR